MPARLLTRAALARVPRPLTRAALARLARLTLHAAFAWLAAWPQLPPWRTLLVGGALAGGLLAG